jgi:hypothetical protein
MKVDFTTEKSNVFNAYFYHSDWVSGYAFSRIGTFQSVGSGCFKRSSSHSRK